MKYTALGANGPVVSSIGLGCMGMTGTYGKVSKTESIRAIHAAIDAGITLIDTAECYGPLRITDGNPPELFGYANEALVGEALESHRDKVVLSTKIGFSHDESGLRTGQDASADSVKATVEGCLKRLRTDRLDLLYLHRVDPKVEIEETIGAMAGLVTEGKVKHLGLSEASAETMQRACKVHPIAVQQSEYSLWERQPEIEEFERCKSLDMAFVAYAPLGRGFLAGSAKPAESYPEDDYRRMEPRLQKGNFEANMAIADKVRDMAAEKGLSAAQLAIAWVVNMGVVPIPGAERPEWAVENAKAATVELSEEDMARLNEIAPQGIAAGPRWGGAWAKQVNK